MVLGVMWMMTALMVGFMLGRVSMYGQLEQTEEEIVDALEGEVTSAGEVKKCRRRGKGRQEDDRISWSVGSPVSGSVVEALDRERPTVVIYPEGDGVYAPANGKITRLFPMGNAFLMTTEFGTELYIQVGDVNDELMVQYYRPRILQNEVVCKGKLLLEFDRQGLEMDGASADVVVSVESCRYGGDVRMTAGERVKIGEEILQVKEEAPQRIQIAASLVR